MAGGSAGGGRSYRRGMQNRTDKFEAFFFTFYKNPSLFSRRFMWTCPGSAIDLDLI